MNNKYYQEEENQLLTTFINSYYLKNDKFLFENRDNFHDVKTNFSPEGPGLTLELIVRPECDQHCDYCYIAKYGKELYPLSTRKDKQGILKNIRILFNYFFNEKNIFIRKIELFAGDLFSDNLYFDICDLIYEYYKPIYDYYPYLFEQTPIEIITPNNFSWIENEEIKNKIREKTTLLRKINIILGFSCSTDGLYGVSIREKKEISEDYFIKMFQFIDEMGYGLHPMVSAEIIDNMIDNYDWWMEMCQKYLPERYSNKEGLKVFYTPIFLEVRNSNWTEEKINKYIEFLNYIWDYRLEIHDNNNRKLARHLFIGDGKEDTYVKIEDYDPLTLFYLVNPQKDYMPCSIQHIWHINISDLSFPPCHRLAYQQFKGGKFILNETEDKIIGIEAINPTPYIAIKTLIPYHMPKCAGCDYKSFCLKGCLGSQYENSGEVLLPIPKVCNFMQRKIDFLLEKYYESGVFQIGRKEGWIPKPLLIGMEEYYFKRGYKI